MSWRLPRALAAAALLTLAPGAATAAEETSPSIPAKVSIAAGFAALDDGTGCNARRREALYLAVQNDGKTDLAVTHLKLL
jgi:hypothetical protein